MKTTIALFSIILASFGVAFWPPQLTYAQCPQICEDSSTGLGIGALQNTTGFDNTAVGRSALQNNTTASNNTAIGSEALGTNTTGVDNTAVGYDAMVGDVFNGSTGSNNTATGYHALFTYTTGSNNTATGYEALFSSKTANNNTANGFRALFSNTVGVRNTADGENALRNNTIGSSNVALGSNAGFNLTTGSNNIDIFDRGVAGEANTIRIGTAGTQTATFIAGISGATVPTGVAVIVDSSGHLGTVVSSARFKDEIKPMDKASEAILSLHPVTFHYKREIDPEGIPQFGLVAEEVEKVNPDLVARDDEGKPYSVPYEAVNAMLLNEFLKEHRKVESLEKAMAEQQKENAAMRAILSQQASQIQKVSAQLKTSNLFTQTFASNH